MTEVTSAATTMAPDMPVHESGDILLVFANKDSTTGMTETTGFYTLLNSGDITTTAWSGVWWRRATSNGEDPPNFTWTSETANFVIVSVKNVHATHAPTAYLSSDDSTIPFTQDQSISTPTPNCLVLHGIGNDVGIGAEPYPGVAQIIYAGDAGANGIGVSWAFYPLPGSIGNPTFWGWQQQPTQIHTVVIEDDGNNTEVQGYVDRSTTPCTLLLPYTGATLFGWTQQTAVSPLVIGNEFSYVWTYNGTSYTNETADMASATAADVPMSNLVNSALYLGSDTEFNKFALWVSTAGAGGTVVWQYYNGSTWATLPMLNAADSLTGTGAHSFQFNIPTNWATYDVNGQTKYWVRLNTTVARTTGATISQGMRDGAACGYDAITASADLGVNPYHSVSNVSQTSHAFNLVGNEMLYSGGVDLSSGYLVGTFMFTSPRDWVDAGFVERLGAVTQVMDTSNNFRAWIIGAKGSATTFSDRRNIYAIQLDETEGSYFASQGSFNAAAVDTIGQYMCSPYGAQSINYSMLMKTNVIVVAGGRPNLPLAFGDVVDAITNGCSLFPFMYRVGSAVTVWSPIKFGGGDAIHVNISLRTFQFPAHYDLEAKVLDYHVDANQTGVEFQGSSGDTIRFNSCVFTSDSSYYWRINEYSSDGADWDFGGTSIINAVVTLLNVTTFDSMTFSGCPSIDASECTLTNCKIEDVPSTNDSFIVTV